MYNKNESFSETVDQELKRSKISQLISLAVLLILVIGTAIWRSRGSNPLNIQWTETHLTITDPTGTEYAISAEDIRSLSYRSDWEFGECIDGAEDKLYRYGVWENSEAGTYQLHASKGSNSVIVLETADNITALSYANDEATKELYEVLAELYTGK